MTIDHSVKIQMSYTVIDFIYWNNDPLCRCFSMWLEVLWNNKFIQIRNISLKNVLEKIQLILPSCYLNRIYIYYFQDIKKSQWARNPSCNSKFPALSISGEYTQNFARGNSLMFMFSWTREHTWAYKSTPLIANIF